MRCDAAQFSKMYADVYQDLYRYALCMMKNPQDTEDAVSDAVLAAFENIGKLKNPDAFKSWIFTITTNICRKKLKALSKKQENETEVTEAVAGSHSEDWGVSIDVQNAFFILTEEEKEIIGLSVFGGYNSKEIGEILSMNSNTVRSKLNRALEKMEKILK